jgi:hypothetical protein
MNETTLTFISGGNFILIFFLAGFDLNLDVEKFELEYLKNP